MTKYFMISILVFLTACSSNNSAVTALATRLANEGGVGVPKEYRDGYISCGVRALSNVPSKKIDAALHAPDASAIWKILGSDTLDAYVNACRQTDLRRASPRKA